VAIVITIVVAVMIVVATFTRLFQLVALLFCLAAVLTVFADSLMQFLFSLANLLLASVVAVAGACRNRSGCETKYNECSDEKPKLCERHDVSLQ
jgi:uncharacterized membrane protein YphA (DoxX/SURF4 family)